jgi:hypothetical protein
MNQLRDLSLANCISGREYTAAGWADRPHTIPNVESLVDLLTGRSKKRQLLTSVLNGDVSGLNSLGIYERLTLENGNWSYCAGQDYPSELAFIRNQLTK